MLNEEDMLVSEDAKKEDTNMDDTKKDENAR
jgi:hypothetical protein